MGNLGGESREQNCKDKVTRFRSVTYVRQLGLLVNTLGSHLNCSNPEVFVHVGLSTENSVGEFSKVPNN